MILFEDLLSDIDKIIFSLIDVNDYVYCSMVCVNWNKFCKYKYEKIKKRNEIPIYCAYYLNLWMDEYHTKGSITVRYFTIDDVNILNVLSHYCYKNGYGSKIYTLNKHRIINVNVLDLYEQYCKLNILNKHTKYIIEIERCQYSISLNKMLQIAKLSNAANIISFLENEKKFYII